MPNQYFMMRHGQSEANVQGLIVSNPVNGIEHYGLTTTGRQQVAQSLAAAAESVAAVLARTSKLIRQLETKQSNQAYLLVAHGDTLQILQTAFLATPVAEHRALQSLAVAEVRPLGSWPGDTT